MFFQSGHDYFDELAAVGLDNDTAKPIAEETWHQIGTDVINHIADFYRGYAPPERPYWAEEQFGPPSTRRRVGRKKPARA
jgi:hypothetical protein